MSANKAGGAQIKMAIITSTLATITIAFYRQSTITPLFYVMFAPKPNFEE